MKTKDMKTTFRMKRNELVDEVKAKAEQAQKIFEDFCECIIPARDKTIVVLSDSSYSELEEMKSGLLDLANFDCVYSEFDFFTELGKNSVASVVIQVNKIRSAQAVIDMLRKRDLKVFVVYRGETPDLDIWKKEFQQIYMWPEEIGDLSKAIKASYCQKL